MRLCRLLGFVALAVLGLSSLAVAAEPAAVDALIKELRGEGAAEKRTPQELEAAYGKVLDALLPKIGSDNIPERQGPCETLQALCWRASRPGADAERAAVSKAIAAKLATDLPKPARIWLTKQLLHVGRAESVDALAAELTDKDAEVRDWARRALSNNPAPEAGEKLAAALQAAGTPDERIALINALGYRRDKAAAPALIPQASADDDAVRIAAVEALALTGDPSAAEPLAAAMAKGGPRARAMATDSYLLLADKLCQGGDKAAALAMYRKLLDATSYLRCAAIVGVGRAGGAAELDTIFRALADEDAKVRGAAMEALGIMPAGEVTQALTARLKTADPPMKIGILRVLAQRSDKAGLPAFLAAAEDPTEGIRVAAYEGLAALKDPKAADVVVAALVKAKDKELEAARNAVNAIQGDEVAAALAKALAGAPPAARVEIVRCLALRGSRVTPTLLETTGDQDAGVRAESLKALADIADDKALPLFVKLLVKATDANEIGAAEKAITAIARRVGDADKCAEPLLAAYAQAPAPARATLLRVLGRIGGTKALGAVRTALKDEEAQTQEAAFRTLADWPDGTVAPDLLDLAKGSTALARRVLALRGYVRAIGLLTDKPADDVVRMYEDAMAVAQRPEDKKVVLAGMAGVASLGALKMAQKCVGDEALRDEALLAEVKIARNLIGSHREEAATALRQAIAEAKSPQVAKEAREALNMVEKFEDYITAWQVAGPYVKEGVEGPGLFDVVFPPEKPDAKGVAWKVMPVGTTPDKPWLLELDKVLGGNDRAAYLRTRIYSPTKQQARFEMGSDDGIKVWLNGKVVHANNATRPNSPGSDQARATLEEGWNTVLLKITQGGGEWSACLRVRRPDGAKLEGIRAQIDGK